MGAYLISVTAVVCLGVLLDIILPDGQMNKYVRSVFSLIVVFVLIAPLPKVFNKELDFDISMYEVLGGADDDGYAATLERYSLLQKSSDLEKVLLKEGITAKVTAERSGVAPPKISVKLFVGVLSAKEKNIILERTLILTEKKFGTERKDISVTWGDDGS